ncbi:MAG: hypothetical protein V3V12_09215 [Gammaproteobacteria bacterium]
MKRLPQEAPLSTSALFFALLLYIITDYLLASATSGNQVAIGMTTLDVLVMVLLLFILLKTTSNLNRFQKSLTAFAGSGALLALFAVPLVEMVGAKQASDQMPASLVIAWLVLTVWSFTVRAYLYRHVLSSTFSIGALVAILHALVVYSVVEMFYPTSG